MGSHATSKIAEQKRAGPRVGTTRQGVHVDNADLGHCQNYGPFLDPYYNTGPNTGPNLGDPKRDHNFDNPQFSLKNLKPGGESSFHPIECCRARYQQDFRLPLL